MFGRYSRGVCLAVLCSLLWLASRAGAQDLEIARQTLISPQEGEEIVVTASELQRSIHPKPDCSHLVNRVYSEAGFDYEFATSRELFDGVDSFKRVSTPQAGDLIVWRGHVGIVVDPESHQFYSALRVRISISDYKSPYWIRRGKSRFYRYRAQATPARALALSNDEGGVNNQALRLKFFRFFAD